MDFSGFKRLNKPYYRKQIEYYRKCPTQNTPLNTT